ncbi:hypothetical protein G7085_19920 [Tessaracoccus sp. HDW20]|uniref:hypothetical protein n=1 Tax=Tessaracoccus coleopterorum TaxID=2714950 RepID=UPI0018D3E91B|nr:hypothetical protein [Tessaracoccus coleopterorum]NHB86032.1 hypothetical protein [Tessaracoccus coleopterorum]
MVAAALAVLAVNAADVGYLPLVPRCSCSRSGSAPRRPAHSCSCCRTTGSVPAPLPP